LLNLKAISAIFSDFYASLKDGQEQLHSGLDSALYLHQALYETCLGESLTIVPETTRLLLRVGALRALDPKLVERTYSTLSLILRTIAPSLLKSEANLRSTWEDFRPYLNPKGNKRYVRKCVAEAWSGVIRKARAEGVIRVMDVMLEGGDAKGIEAVCANSLRSGPGKLHSRAPPIFENLLDRLQLDPSEQYVISITRVITALVHHCSSTTSIPVVEAVIFRLDRPKQSGASTPTASATPSTTILDCLSTLLLTRKGKRFPETLLKPTMLKLASLAIHLRDVRDGAWRRMFLSCVIGCLQAGKLTQWLSPGVNLIDTVWEGLVSFDLASKLLTNDRIPGNALLSSICLSRLDGLGWSNFFCLT